MAFGITFPSLCCQKAPCHTDYGGFFKSGKNDKKGLLICIVSRFLSQIRSYNQPHGSVQLPVCNDSGETGKKSLILRSFVNVPNSVMRQFV